MVDQKLIDNSFERKFKLFLIDICKNDVLVNTNQSDVHVKKDCDEGEPVKILIMIVNKVTFIPILHVALVQEAH